MIIEEKVLQQIILSYNLNSNYWNFEKYNNNNTTSQCGSRFHGVWGDPNVGSLTSIEILGNNW